MGVRIGIDAVKAIVGVRAVALVLFAVALVFQAAAANTYVSMKNGRLLVFPDECVQSMNQTSSVVTIVAVDGTVYTYSMDKIASVGNQLPKVLPTITSYKFYSKDNYQMVGNATGNISSDGVIDATVAVIGKRLTASFVLSDASARAVVDGVEQTSRMSRLRFDEPRVYTVGYRGDLVLRLQQSGRCAMEPFGREYVVNVDFKTDHSTSVPRIDINTVGGVNIVSKTEYVDAQIIIDGAGVFPSMTDSMQIRGRGNDTWSPNPAAKNPYRLKFKQKVRPLGLTAGKNWVLLANRRSGSMLTNAIGMKAASLMGTVAVNNIIPVDLYINGTYKGSYNFTEKVGLATNSVDLDDEGAAALLELDLYYDEDATQKFRSTPFNLPVNVKRPNFGEDATVLTLAAIRQRFNQMAAAVESGGDISGHVDIDAAARYLLLNELISNAEMLHPKSTFCYNENILSDTSRFIFGPAWDMDWAFGYNGVHAGSYFLYCKAIDIYNFSTSWEQNPFVKYVHNAPGVKQRSYYLLKNYMGEPLDELCEYCLDYYHYAKPSLNNNKNAGLDSFDYYSQVVKAMSWLRERADNVRAQLLQGLYLRGDVDGDGVVGMTDLVQLIDCLLQNDFSQVIEENSDVDDDGDVDIADVAALLDVLLLAKSN